MIVVSDTSPILNLSRVRRLDLLASLFGRTTAKKFGLRVTGLLGVLVEAKQAGLIERVKPVLDELISQARFWVSPDLYHEVLATAGET